MISEPRRNRPGSMSELSITGVVLAGGLARRMEGADKGLIFFKGAPLVKYALNSLKPLCEQVYINANRNHESYQALGFPLITDLNQDFNGPLAGILSVMSVAKTPYIMSTPCDCPLIDAELLARLVEPVSRYNCDGSVVHDGERLHPVFLLLDCGLKDSLKAYLDSGKRKIDVWLSQHKIIEVDYSDVARCFKNINAPADLLMLEDDHGA